MCIRNTRCEMFLTSVPLHCAHEGRKVRCGEWMGMWGDGCMPKADSTLGHIAITSWAVNLSLKNSGTFLCIIKYICGVLAFLQFSS